MNDPSKVIPAVNPSRVIRYWYDPHLRLWTVLVEEADSGWQVGEADYAPNKAELELAIARQQVASMSSE